MRKRQKYFFVPISVSLFGFKQKEIEGNCEIFNGKSERCVVIDDMCRIISNI